MTKTLVVLALRSNNSTLVCIQAKADACSADAICRVATPIGSVGIYSQCNDDSDCDKVKYSTSEAGEDVSRPPRKYCCADMVQLVSAHCNNFGADIVHAKWRTLRYQFFKRIKTVFVWYYTLLYIYIHV